MRLNIYDPNNLELIGVLSNYQSVQWKSTYNTPDGTFTITCSVDSIGLMEIERLIENTEEPEHIGVIKKVQTVSSNEKEYLQVQGIMLEKDIFYKRVIKAWIMYLDMHPITTLEHIIGLTMTDPAEPERRMNLIGEINFPTEAELSDIEKTQYSCNYANLGDEVFSLIQGMDVGVKSCINHETDKIDITFYKGEDYTQGADDSVIFSPERGTVLETSYVVDSSQNFTNIVVIGEGNVILQAERERTEYEPMIEKSIDLASEIPHPTIATEKPDDEGGSYYRYKLYTPPEGFITNCDVWEKYEVEKIETTETCYRKVVSSTAETVNSAELMKNLSVVSDVTTNIKKNGLTVGSGITLATAVNNFAKNMTPGTSKYIGTILNNKKVLSEVNSSAVMSLRASKASSNNSKKSTESTKKSTKKVTEKTNKTSNATGTSSKKTALNAIKTAGEVAKQIVAVANEGVPITYQSYSVSLEPYQVTTTTYETGDFLEYVYVNPGDNPTSATKVVQGSAASGDVIYYENYEDVKVPESEYRNILMKKAQEYLKTYVISESITVKPYMLSNMIYGKNYKIGDLITTRNKVYGFSVDMRVTEVSEVWDSKGYSLSLTLGDNIPTLTNRIKLLSKGGI